MRTTHLPKVNQGTQSFDSPKVNEFLVIKSKTNKSKITNFKKFYNLFQSKKGLAFLNELKKRLAFSKVFLILTKVKSCDFDLRIL